MGRIPSDPGMPVGSAAGPRQFLSTAWSMILQAQSGDKQASRKYLGFLVQRYWRPVYFYVRHFTGDHDEAKDVTQSFFASFLEKDAILYADRNRGRFRNFLVASVKRYMQQKHRRAKLRPSEVPIADFESVVHARSFAMVQGEDPARAFMRDWGKCLVETCLARLREECVALGKGMQFKVFHARFLHGVSVPPSYKHIARQLGISEKDVDNCFERAKRRFARIFRGEVQNSISAGEQVDDEIRLLLGVLAS